MHVFPLAFDRALSVSELYYSVEALGKLQCPPVFAEFTLDSTVSGMNY